MKKRFKKHEIYETPRIFYTKYNPLRIIGYIYISLISVVLLILSIILVLYNFYELIILRLIPVLLLIYFISDLLHGHVYKKQYIQFTDDHLKIKKLITTKLIKWTDIYSIEVATHKFNTYIGIVHDNDFWLKTPSFIQYIIRVLGFFNIMIFLNKFDDLDERKLFNTICNRLPRNLFK